LAASADAGARRDRRARDLDVLDRGPGGGGLHRAVEAQHLLDRVGHAVRLGPQQLPGTRGAQQRVHRARDEVHGGLVPGDEQQVDHRGQFVLAEPVAAVAGRDQRRDEVVARLRALDGDELVQVAHELGDRRRVRLQPDH
jgi:hypothetical protein